MDGSTRHETSIWAVQQRYFFPEKKAVLRATAIGPADPDGA